MIKKFLKFRYAAIRRYGDRLWTACDGVIEFNTGYTVGVSRLERGGFDMGLDRPYVVELSNGTRFLCFLHNYGDLPDEEILGERGEAANSFADDACQALVKKNIGKLNGLPQADMYGRRDD
ncbi:MAG: hypothetical protein ACI3YD_03970 [Alloprevotella sp.]